MKNKIKHPGIVFREHYFEPLKISIREFARRLKADPTQIALILRGKRDISTKVAYRLHLYLHLPVDTWARLQVQFDLAELTEKQLSKIRKEVKTHKPK